MRGLVVVHQKSIKSLMYNQVFLGGHFSMERSKDWIDRGMLEGFGKGMGCDNARASALQFKHTET